ncbi:glycosyltransferase family 2 protein [Emticicia sp. BO119]|uniref:glycosyltransferase family 2 protein n=1 Tax=Emticicia sp. BO119 TaxID=2757768 RepID=UPI0015F1085C|nr:glycosyltransferase family A protein [Emticicia sp. BO119]MBA4853045.1 glycosyltransferase family 2 protein [Emticicia sp. BO119]
MKISIIITAYNVEKYIAEAVESALKQTYTNTEIIVINDGSTDDTLQILHTFEDKIILVSQENIGLAKTLNKALKLASGELIAFLDGDDILLENKLEKQIKEFEHNQGLEATFGTMKQFLSPELLLHKERYQFIKGEVAAQSKITSLFRKKVFIKYGNFPEVQTLDFIIWFDSAKSKGIVYNQTDNLVVYRRVRDNSHSQENNYYSYLLRFLKDRINNKRMVNS